VGGSAFRHAHNDAARRKPHEAGRLTTPTFFPFLLRAFVIERAKLSFNRAKLERRATRGAPGCLRVRTALKALMGKSPIMFLIFTACSLAPPPWDVDCKNRIHTITNSNAANLNGRSVAYLGSNEKDPAPPFGGYYGRQPDVWSFMMEIDILGIDLAKLIFQLHGADRRGRVLHRAKISRGSLFESVRTLKPRLVVMEACSSAHH
jgi:hypothetical protein